MKKLYAFIAVLAGVASYSQTITIPDANFKALVTNQNLLGTCCSDINGNSMVVDTNGDGEIQVSEALGVYSINVGARNISSLTGIEYFTNLNSLHCNANNITSLNVATLINLTSLGCNDNDITSLNISSLANLQILNCGQNKFTALNASGLSNLTSLSCGFNNLLTSVNVTGCNNLQWFSCEESAVTSLNLTNLSQVTTLRCGNNRLTSLTLTGMTGLKDLLCDRNLLPSLSLTGLTSLENVYCNNNKITSLNAGNIPTLKVFIASYNLLTSVNVTGSNNLTRVEVNSNSLTGINVSGLVNVTRLDVSVNQLTSLNVSGLNSIETLYCNQNHIPSLDVSSLTNLNLLNCGSNAITSLILGNLIHLEGLTMTSNSVTSLDISGLTGLKNLTCGWNLLTTLNADGLSLLQSLYCNNNNLTSLSLNGLVNLSYLYCHYNSLTSLNLSALTKLNFLQCNNNQLTTLDLNGLTNFQYLNAETNNLTSVFIKNGVNEQSLAMNYNPNLTYICADESQFATIQSILNIWGYSNCQVSSYCTFAPGGVYYTINGAAKFDSNNNGCDNSDIAMPNAKFDFVSGTTTGTSIANASGMYSFPVKAGTHLMTPVLENPGYFTIFPTFAAITFPAQASPFTQNFCLSANGTHNDLEAVLLPTSRARPGFDATYKILYKNKGTTIQNGSVSLTFDDAKLDVVAALPATDSQATNNLSWNFSNLKPFEAREILLTLNINSPLETPAVNGGDVLAYTVMAVGATDETPADNTAPLNQIVTNSLDPNDKTCLEGTAISPSSVGNYVHYIIRFENTGTDNAQNIVVKDIIDSNKYDISTLVPMHGSAPFVTRVTNTNQVEFIFENIDLPFDDAHNDGYVAFKIKTKSTLVVGNSFSNNASIYFDYNAPIVTNTATTVVQALGNQDFGFATIFSLSPVPAKDILTITRKQEVTISSISIYNTLGQLIQIETNPNESIDVSNLNTGNYFIRIVSDKGTLTGKFIKQ